MFDKYVEEQESNLVNDNIFSSDNESEVDIDDDYATVEDLEGWRPLHGPF